MWITNMAYSDRLIIDSVRELEGRPNITARAIATHAKVPYGTAKHALDRLEKAGQIQRTGAGRRWGYQYQVKDGA